jgi:hypothetical protein
VLFSRKQDGLEQTSGQVVIVKFAHRLL